MLIKSQDGKVIVNTNTLVSLNVYNGKIYCDTKIDSSDEGTFIMGSYDTDDEALSELDKLCKFIDKYDLGGEKNAEEHVDRAPGEFPF